ncbi:response regulator [bacterium]|nr:response regulator [bacterium]
MSRRFRVLAVDDENDILLILRTSLRDDYDVTTASNGPEALQKIQDEMPDVIILDMMMPDMDGIEVLEELRRDPATAALPVIFLTGVSDRAKIREALDKGTSFYITKPFSHRDLTSKVEQALREGRNATS